MKTGTLENIMLSPLPTPAPAAFALMTTVDPVVLKTVVPARIDAGVVRLDTTMPATTHDGVEAKCRVLFPDAVELFVAVGLLSVVVAFEAAVISYELVPVIVVIW